MHACVCAQSRQLRRRDGWKTSVKHVSHIANALNSYEIAILGVASNGVRAELQKTFKWLELLKASVG